MASVKGEIDRLVTAKTNIEQAIEECGVDVPNTALISTYADYVRAIPNAILSQLNLSEVGGDDKYIKKISQTNGVISASEGGVFTKSGSSASVGLVPKPSTTAGTSKYLREDCSWATPPNYYPKSKFTTGVQITDTSDSTNYTDGNIYVPKASASQLGVIRTNYTDNGKNYKVDVNSSGDAYVNVPWANYYPKRSYTSGLQITTTSDSTNYAYGTIYVPYATSSQAGAVSTSKQTFAGSKTFTDAMTVCNTITFGTEDDHSDNYGIRTPVNNYTNIGASGKAFYYAYVNNLCPGSNGTGYVGTSSTRYANGYFSGAVYATSGFYESSDENLKHVLGPVKVDLQKLSKLRKVYYLWKDNPDNGQQLGMIAQDVQKLYPELVDTDEETGLLSLAYDRLSVVALEALDTLYNEHKVLKERVDKIEKLLKDKEIS